MHHMMYNRCIAMRTTINLDERLIEEAQRITGTRERTALIHDGLRALIARGVPEDARPFGGLVYRQALEHLHGVRDEPATRSLIVQENKRYARRQLIWFRKEPTLAWFDGPGESPATIDGYGEPMNCTATIALGSVETSVHAAPINRAARARRRFTRIAPRAPSPGSRMPAMPRPPARGARPADPLRRLPWRRSCAE